MGTVVHQCPWKYLLVKRCILDQSKAKKQKRNWQLKMLLTNLHKKLMGDILVGFTKFLVLLVCMYFFVCSLSFLSSGFKIAGGKNLGLFFENSEILSNPVVGVMLGVLITVLVQSSSTSTSILVGLVAAGAPVSRVIPMVLGANIGTSVTNTVVAITQMGDREQFRKSFSCATVHDMFNWLSVILFTSLECFTPFLENITGFMVDNINFNSSSTVQNPDFLKRITKPLISRIVQLNSNVLEGWAEKNSAFENVTSVLKPGCDDRYCTYLIAYIGPESGILDDLSIGLILVVFSLLLMCVCLCSIVKILNSLIGGKVMEVIKKIVNSDLPYVPWLTGYVAMMVGAILTFLLQSSSVFTSTLTPLAGAGLVTLERAYPLTLGSNIGTTTTSIIASMAAEGSRQRPALQIAMVHLTFNLCGILVFYCVPALRFPVALASKLGNATADHPWFAFCYLAGMFAIIPAVVFCLSLLGSSIPLFVVIVIFGALVAAVTALSFLQSLFPSALPVFLQTWEFLPELCRSLDPYDKLFSCWRNHDVDDEEIGAREELQESAENLLTESPIIKQTATLTFISDTSSGLKEALYQEETLEQVNEEEENYLL